MAVYDLGKQRVLHNYRRGSLVGCQHALSGSTHIRPLAYSSTLTSFSHPFISCDTNTYGQAVRLTSRPLLCKFIAPRHAIWQIHGSFQGRK